VLLAVLSASCGEREDRKIIACEEAVKAMLRSAASYRRISALLTGPSVVELSFDVDGINASPRSYASCIFANRPNQFARGWPYLETGTLNREPLSDLQLITGRDAIVRASAR